MTDKEKTRMLILLSTIATLLIALMVYLTYFMIFEGETYRSSSKNKRNTISDKNVIRGAIYDRNGLVLAETIKGENGNTRSYPYPELYSHVIGYTLPKLGKSGLELSMDTYLINKNNTGIVEAIKRYLEEESIGNSVHLTVDTSVQKRASDLLKGQKGAAVALNPKTGEIYSLVSKPEYDPNSLKENWEIISKSPDSVLFNRAINGLYPPGSVMKVISASAILESGIDLNYDHVGSQVIDGYEYRDAASGEYGKIDIEKAFTISLNTYFVKKIQEVGMTRFAGVASKFMFEKQIPFELPVSKSTLNFDSNTTTNQISASSIGQGRVLATPLEMAITAGAIANNGEIMEPHLVSKIVSAKGDLVSETEVKSISQAASPEVIKKIQDLMVKTTNEGTGKNAAINNIQVASKTGTAENETGNTHAWYIGYAPADDPVVAVAVIVEQAGSGGKIAAPIGRDVIISVLNSVNHQ